MKIPIIVSGCCGRMGKIISKCVLDDNDLELIGVFEFPQHADVGKDFGEIIGVGKLGIKVSPSIKDISVERAVIIDFTFPEVTHYNIEYAVEKKFPIVIGTTGFDKGQVGRITKIAETSPILLSANMSIGVNLLLKLTAETARILGDDYDIEIVETHHRFKKDAPSGTALKIAEAAAQALDRDLDEVRRDGRKGVTGERTRKEIGIHAVRSGDVVGDHTISFSAIGERIELTHKASNRENFAKGAVKAAKYMWDKSPVKLYDMQDVLGLK